MDEADLISYGLSGLINAIERFELEREIKYDVRHHAYPRRNDRSAPVDGLGSRSVHYRTSGIEKSAHQLKTSVKTRSMPNDNEPRRWALDSSKSSNILRSGKWSVAALDELWSMGVAGDCGLAARHHHR